MPTKCIYVAVGSRTAEALIIYYVIDLTDQKDNQMEHKTIRVCEPVYQNVKPRPFRSKNEEYTHMPQRINIRKTFQTMQYKYCNNKKMIGIWLSSRGIAMARTKGAQNVVPAGTFVSLFHKFVVVIFRS